MCSKQAEGDGHTQKKVEVRRVHGTPLELLHPALPEARATTKCPRYVSRGDPF